TSPCAAGNNPSCGWVGALDFSHPLVTVTVDPGGGGMFATIQDAISSSLISGGDTIYLGDGVFTGPGNVDIDLEGKSVVVRSISGDPEDCVIDCQGSSGSPHRGFRLYNREGNAARIEGVTVRNGWTAGAGGGINMSRSDATIKDCLFEKCHAYDGGGIIAFFGEGLIWSCGFDSCTADDAGGGLFLSGGDPTVRDCWFKENWADWGGGGMYNDDSSPLIERCVFAGNTSDHMGGGIHNNHSECEPVIRNCTFSMNAGLNGGAIFSRNFAAPVVYNSIIAFSPEGVAVRVQTDATTTLYCCDVYGNVDGDYVDAILGQDGINGNFSEDPLFCNVYIHYLRLTEASPCTQENGGGCGLIGAVWEGCHTLTDAD
ncbi:MAG TPA: right-handed parallel beta-helix repeat-containing protein, partial [Candidatus Krumholzibacterium sp.]|nr:right-handed parallel beta-helix repeat-containing protein [Candidatus Krumholzibacterium sp.]